MKLQREPRPAPETPEAMPSARGLAERMGQTRLGTLMALMGALAFNGGCFHKRNVTTAPPVENPSSEENPSENVPTEETTPTETAPSEEPNTCKPGFHRPADNTEVCIEDRFTTFAALTDQCTGLLGGTVGTEVINETITRAGCSYGERVVDGVAIPGKYLSLDDFQDACTEAGGAIALESTPIDPAFAEWAREQGFDHYPSGEQIAHCEMPSNETVPCEPGFHRPADNTEVCIEDRFTTFDALTDQCTELLGGAVKTEAINETIAQAECSYAERGVDGVIIPGKYFSLDEFRDACTDARGTIVLETEAIDPAMQEWLRSQGMPPFIANNTAHCEISE